MIGFEMAGRAWSRFSNDKVDINIHVSMTDELPTTVIGGAIPTYVETDVGTVQNALIQDVTSSEDRSAANTFNIQMGDGGMLEYSGLVGEATQQASQLTLTQANAKALGLSTSESSASSLDGHIVLNSLDDSPYFWSYDYSRTAAVTSRSLDFLSVAMHEIGHVMGFISGVDAIDGNAISSDLSQTTLSQTTLLDLYRYSDRSVATDAQELTAGQSAYFSIDGGQTSIAPFSNGVVSVLGGVEGYQASHWANNSLDGTTAKGLTATTTNTAELATDFLTRVFEIAAPATAEDYVDDITVLLAGPGSQSVLANQSSNIRLDDTGSAGFSLGIMDPTLAAGERSQISALDVLAMDVLGYDPTNASINLDYDELLAEAEASIAQKLNISVEALKDNSIESSEIEASEKDSGDSRVLDWSAFFDFDLIASAQRFTSNAYANVDTSALTQDRWQDVLASTEMYERRRRRFKTSRASFWQEDDLDPTVINIISDGAGDSAEIMADAGRSWITAVEALPYAPLILRTVNLVGNDANDLIIPALDQYQTISAGNGDNVVQLGKQGGIVSAGSGHDVIMAMGGRIALDAGDGDNVIVLDDQQSGNRTVVTGEGHDYVNVTGMTVSVNSGAGHDIVVLKNTDTSSLAGILTVTDLAGNNTIQIDGGALSYQTVRTGDGHDTIDVQGNAGSITSGAGNDVIIAKPGVNVSSSAFDITATGGDNIIQVDGGINGSQIITTGQGNDQIQFTSLSAVVTAGNGNDIIIGKNTSTARFYAEDPNYTVNAAGGDNRIHLEGVPKQQINVTTGDGNDVVSFIGYRATVKTGAGDDIISGTNTYGVSSTYRVDAGDGNNTIQLQGHQSQQLYIASGAGDDVMDLMGAYGNIDAGDGNNVIQLEAGDYSSFAINSGDGDDTIQFTAHEMNLSTGDGNDIIIGRNPRTSGAYILAPSYTVTTTGGDNHIYLEGIANQRIDVTTGGGNDVISFIGHNATIKTGAGDDIISGTNIYSPTSTYRVDAGEGNNTIQLQGNTSQTLYVSSGTGDDVMKLRGYSGNIDAGDGNNVIQIEARSRGSFNISSGSGDDNIISGAGNDSIRTGDGNDIISGTDGSDGRRDEIDTITTGDGSDIVILGDRRRAYYASNRTRDYAKIMDFSEQDRLQLHGTAKDYRLTRTQLLYRGDAIATFSGGVNFTLDSDQVYFVNSATESSFDLLSLDIPTLDLPDLDPIDIGSDLSLNVPEINVPEVNVPTVNEILDRVQTTITTVEDPVYSIVGGDDAQFFSIDQNTGDLLWKTVPEFASPMDADGNNKYDVIVQAALGDGNAKQDVDTQNLTIIVQPDTAAAPTPSDSAAQLVTSLEAAAMGAGDALTTSLTGQDGVNNQFDINALPDLNSATLSSSAPLTDNASQQDIIWVESTETTLDPLDSLVLTGSSDPQTVQSQADSLQSSLQNLIAALEALQALDLSSLGMEYV